MITIQIDVTQIDNARLKEVTRKNGETAKFLDLILIETPQGQYGDYMVKQSVTKEERLAGKEMPILGNGKNLNNKPKRQAKPAAEQSGEQAPEESDEVSF